MLNGKSIDQPWFYHEQLIKGGKLTLNMSSNPNKKWGANDTQAPPSMSN
jgi:putative alpha-1,2-mannosidase